MSRVSEWGRVLPIQENTYVAYLHVCCSVFQRVAVCCTMLQCVPVCCSVLQCAARPTTHDGKRFFVLQCGAVCAHVLQSAARHTTHGAKRFFALHNLAQQAGLPLTRHTRDTTHTCDITHV